MLGAIAGPSGPRSGVRRVLWTKGATPALHGMLYADREMHVKQPGLIALMALGSVSLWVLNPLLWFWITSHLQSQAGQAQMGPYVLLLVGVLATAVVLAKALAALNRRYARLIGAEPTVRIIVPWRRSLRDARHGGSEDPGRVPVNVLDVVMVLSVLAALVAFVVWYVVADPTPPNVGGPGPSKD